METSFEIVVTGDPGWPEGAEKPRKPHPRVRLEVRQGNRTMNPIVIPSDMDSWKKIQRMIDRAVNESRAGRRVQHAASVTLVDED